MEQQAFTASSGSVLAVNINLTTGEKSASYFKRRGESPTAQCLEFDVTDEVFGPANPDAHSGWSGMTFEQN